MSSVCASIIYSHYPIKETIFITEVVERKMNPLIFLENFSVTFLFLRRLRRDVERNVRLS